MNAPRSIAGAAGVLTHTALLATPLFAAGDRHPGGAGIVFLVVMTVWCAAEPLAQHAWRRLPAIATLKPSGGLPIAIGAALAATLFVAVTDHATRGAMAHSVPLATMGIGGAIAMIAGVSLRLWSIRTLGPLFLDGVELAPAHPLVMRGPYRWVRHPSETGTLAIAAGACVLLASVPGAVVAMALVGLIAVRIRREDRLLRTRHPAAFVRYAAHTPALLPITTRRPRDAGAAPRCRAARRAAAPGWDSNGG